MPCLTIKDSKTTAPTEIFYEDSGAPDRFPYTTLVVIHGFCFHSAVFKHILLLAASNGLRVVCLNRRGYPGTTPYSPAKLQAFSQSGAEELTALGVELALFLDGLIEKLSLPGPNVDGSEGGLGIMGWSLGNLVTLSTIASVTAIPSNVKARLQSNLRRLIVFEPPTPILGLPSAPGTYAPLFDETIPEAERLREFVRWVSSYFAHGDLSTPKVDNIEFKSPNPDKQSVAASLSSEELNSLVDYSAALGYDISLLTDLEPFLFNQMKKVLFDQETRSLWPKLTIWFLHCDSSPGVMVHAALGVKQLAEANGDQPIQFLTIKSAHHLVFWDDPKRAMEAFDHCLRH